MRVLLTVLFIAQISFSKERSSHLEGRQVFEDARCQIVNSIGITFTPIETNGNWMVTETPYSAGFSRFRTRTNAAWNYHMTPRFLNGRELPVFFGVRGMSQFTETGTINHRRASASVSGATLIDKGASETINVTATCGGVTSTIRKPLEGEYSEYIGFESGTLESHIKAKMGALIGTNSYDNTRRPTGLDDWVQVDGDPILINDPSGLSLPWRAYHIGATTNLTVKRNPNHILSSIDLSCASVWQNESGAWNTKTVTLITDKHVISAAHWTPSVGANIIFLSNDNIPHTNSIMRRTEFDPGPPFGSDVMLSELSSRVPTNIVPCQVYDLDWMDYFISNTISPDYTIGFFIDQRKHVVLTGTYNGSSCLLNQTVSDPYYSLAVNWDSSCPLFTIINGRPVLGSCFKFPAGGAYIGNYADRIDEQIAAWDGTQTVDRVDLTGFLKPRR